MERDDREAVKVFISYSRKDLDFAKRIVSVLNDFKVLIDLNDIAPSEKWWSRIKDLIVQCNTVIFILSPEATASEVCKDEIDFAVSLNKRLVPIVARKVVAHDVPAALAELNWISFDDPLTFPAQCLTLKRAITADIDWVRQHTKFSEPARLWELAGRPGQEGLLLRPPRLTEAEAFLIAPQPRGVPYPAQLRAFVAVSRQAYDDEQATIALSQVDLLAEVAEGQLLRGNIETALRLSAHASRRALEIRPRTVDASRAAAVLAASVDRCNWDLMLSGHAAWVNQAAFRADGSTIATASRDGTASVWSAANGERTAVLRPEESEPWRCDWVEKVFLSETGSHVATVSHSGKMMLWNARTGASTATILDSASSGFARFSANGSRFAVAFGLTMAQVWDTTTGAALTKPLEHAQSVKSLAFSPDGSRLLTTLADGTARIWEIETGLCTAQLSAHADAVEYAIFTPDGLRAVSVSADGTVWQWDPKSGTGSVAWRDPGLKHFVAFSGNAQRVLTREDGFLRIWDFARQCEIARIQPDAYIACADLSFDGKRLVGASTDGMIIVWHVDTGRRVTTLRARTTSFNTVVFDRDGSRIVSSSPQPAVFVWNASHGTELLTLRHDSFVVSAVFRPDGKRVATASRDGGVRIWDAKTSTELQTFKMPEGVVESAVFSPDGLRLAAAAGIWARVWDIGDESNVVKLEGHFEKIYAVAFDREGRRVVSASRDGTARVWDAVSGKELVVLKGHERGLHSAVFSFDGKAVATASEDETARIWDLATATCTVVLRGHEEKVGCVVFSPDGTRLATSAYDNTVLIWDARTGQDKAILRGHGSSVEFAEFSPDGSHLVTASSDRTARIWHVATGKMVAVLAGHEDAVLGAAFSPDGQQIVTAGKDKTARIWACDLAVMPASGLLDEVCSRRLLGCTKLSREEMRLAGYPDEMAKIDVGHTEAR